MRPIKTMSVTPTKFFTQRCRDLKSLQSLEVLAKLQKPWVRLLIANCAVRVAWINFAFEVSKVRSQYLDVITSVSVPRLETVAVV